MGVRVAFVCIRLTLATWNNNMKLVGFVALILIAESKPISPLSLGAIRGGPHAPCEQSMAKFCPDLRGADTAECQQCTNHTAACMADKTSGGVQANFCKATSRAFVKSSYCYGSANCTAPCTVNEVPSGECSNQTHDGRLTSFSLSCNTTTVVYETFGDWGCRSAHLVGSNVFETNKCYPFGGNSGTTYSCPHSDVHPVPVRGHPQNPSN